MIWSDASQLARAGIAIRRATWPIGKTLVWSAGAGTTRAVPEITQPGGSVGVVRASEFGQAEFEATDWKQA